MEKFLKNKALWAAGLSAVLMGMTNYYAKIFLDAVNHDAFLYLSGRYTVAFLSMLVLLWSGKYHISLKRRKGIGLLVLNGLLSPILAQSFENIAILYAPISQIVVIQSTAPLVVVFLSALINRETPTRKQFLYLLLTVFGVVVIRATGGGDKGSLTGFILAVLFTFSIALSRTFVRRLTAEFSAFEIIFVSVGMGAVSFTAVSVIQNLAAGTIDTYFNFLHIPTCVFSLFYNGVISCAVGFLLATYAAGRLPIAIAQSISLLNMPVAILLGVCLLGERFSLVDVLGSVLIGVGVVASSSHYDANNEKENQYHPNGFK